MIGGMYKAAVAILLVAAIADSARAGLGPQNVLVVVNSKSWASKTVANEYVKVRNIPACNVVSIDLDLGRQDHAIDVDTFRDKILAPVLDAIKARGLEQQIACIAYSSDIPTAIDYGKDIPKPQPALGQPPARTQQFATGSINGMTYFYEAVLEKDYRKYTSLTANRYYRKEEPSHTRAPITPQPAGAEEIKYTVEPTAGFSRIGYDELGKATQGGQKYYLSIVLGVTSNRGNSVDEVLECIRRSAKADGTAPKDAGFYYVFNTGIRTTTRQWGFKSAIAALAEMKLHAKIDGASVPRNKDDIMGAMLGQSTSDPTISNSKTLPGAIVENLTSEGGIMTWAGGQTPISEFIRFGAAGTSGTVTEPYAIQAKFPTPFLFVHYARGATLVEAFYQSIQGPFQILIVGDPLCQPYASLPQVKAAADRAGGKITVKPSIDGDAKVEAFEVYVDGRLKGTCQAGKDFSCDDVAGAVEVCVAAVMADEPRTRAGLGGPDGGAIILPAGTVRAKADKETAAYGQKIKLSVDAAGAKAVYVAHLGRTVGVLKEAKGDIEIDTSELGMGACRLSVMAQIGDKLVAGQSVEVNIAPAKALPAKELPRQAATAPGAILKAATTQPMAVLETRRGWPLQDAKLQAGTPFTVEGYVDAPDEGVYQFQVFFPGKMTLKVDGVELPIGAGSRNWRFVPVTLAKGKHLVQISGEPTSADREFDIRFGGYKLASRSMGDKNFVYVKE